MKRLMLMITTLMLLANAAGAQVLPDTVLERCAKSYPGYAVLASDGYDDGSAGQWAIVLTKDGDNALVVAERMDGGSYALTVSNPAALPDEGDNYSTGVHTISVSLSKEQRNDRLAFLEMTIEQPGVSKWVVTSELQEDGRTWGNVIGQYTEMYGDENVVWWSHMFAEDGSLNYMRHTETPEGKPLHTETYPRIPVRGEALSAHLLNCFDAGSYPYMPAQINGKQLSDYAYDWLGETEELRQLDVKPDGLILLTENRQGQRMLRIIPWSNNQFHGTQLVSSLPKNASLDLYHAGEDELEIEWYDGKRNFAFGITRKAVGVWEPDWLQVDTDTGSTNFLFTYNSIASAGDAFSPQRNDGVYYGRHPWQDITQIDFDTLPASLDEALALLDQSGYAFVNNPNPEDRLHLRELPRKDARSFGKFYNRTPVCVISIEGEWAYVSIGSLSGWMMTKYLAFGEEMDGVKCAFPQEFIREEYDSLQLQPYGKGSTVAHIDRETTFYIVGVEDERYVILTEDGKCGYVKQTHFYPGNG